ncbi:Chaperone protein DnaJ [Lachnellula arida]|uniref:Chaperone protein DnaJ n=1 Tax=Lachnellula arida TaxID=1316785 RepID=A0A8T9B0C1_9HELO|nr:Chaperone protein DnaJ [Lachnellula arida]
MAPVPITEDYYMVLEVEQTATAEIVLRSYKRLALKLHPDRNTKHDATAAFQLLGTAYETLMDETKRQAYDLIYPSIKRNHPSPQTTQTSHSPPTSSPQSRALSEAAQIAALQKSKQDRGARWWPKKNALASSIFELQRDIRRLEHEIQNLNSILAAEAAEEAQKNSWGTWLLSPIYKKAEDSKEEKARKDIERQERRIEKDMKERRLGLKNADLEIEERWFRKGKEEVDAADLVDNRKIQSIQHRMREREIRERQERERVERERTARIWKQQQEQREKREREVAEALRKRQEDQARKGQRTFNDDQYPFTAEGNTYQASKILCGHDCWWPKVQGYTACPECNHIWSYLLQCPGCKMQACPKCQYTIRPRGNRRPPKGGDSK